VGRSEGTCWEGGAPSPLHDPDATARSAVGPLGYALLVSVDRPARLPQAGSGRISQTLVSHASGHATEPCVCSQATKIA
jgi:hypothetical protein